MSEPLTFLKMSGAGNDFVVLERADWDRIGGDRALWVRRVTRRGLSVGSDGVLVVGAAAGGAVRVVFLNPDGGEAFCGNGSRCAARFAHLRGLAPASMTLETAAGRVPAVVSGPSVRLTLGPPEDRGERSCEAAGRTVSGRLVLAGVPHFVLTPEQLSGLPFAALAPAIRRDPALGAQGANVDLAWTDDSGVVHVRTWERGVEGETLACGSGAVAAAFAARLTGAAETVEVLPKSGIPLRVGLPGDRRRPDRALLEGDARVIYEGTLHPEGIAGPA